MGVAHDAVSTYGGSVSNVSSFQWTHTPSGTPNGVIVFVAGQNLTMSAMVDTAVTYGGRAMTKIPYTAFTTSTERGSVSAYFLNDPPSGAQTVVVTRTNNNVVTNGVCCTVTADNPITVPSSLVRTVVGAETPKTGASSTGTSTASGWSSLTTIGDGSPGTNSQRYLSVYSGTGTAPTAGTNTTRVNGYAFAANSWSVFRETTPSQGDVTLGTSSITDDLAAIGFAVIERGVVNRNTAQANATIIYSPQVYAQANARITGVVPSVAQANALLRGFAIYPRGTASNNTSSTTSTISPSSNILFSNSLITLLIAYDNTGTGGTDPFGTGSITDTKGNTWTSRHVTVNDPSTSTGIACVLRIATTNQNAGKLTTSDVVTITYQTATKTEVMALWEASTTEATYVSFKTTGTGAIANNSAPTVTTGTITVGDAIIGGIALEYSSLPTAVDTDTTNGVWSAAQYGVADDGVTERMSLTTQYKIQTTANSTQTFNSTFPTGSEWAAGWIVIAEADIYNSFAQAQAEISPIISYAQVAQAQSNILATYNVVAQSLGIISTITYQYAQTEASIVAAFQQNFAQSQALIKTTYLSFAQAVANILGYYTQIAQSQSTILASYYQYSQANAWIYTINYPNAQAESFIIYKNNSYAQANAIIQIIVYEVGQSQATILATNYQVAQAQSNVAFTGNTSSAQSQALIQNGLMLFTRGTVTYPGNDPTAILNVSPTKNFLSTSMGVLVIAYANAGSQGVDQGCSVSDSLGNTWTIRHITVNDPSIVQGAGVVLRIATTSQNVALLTTSTVVTATLGAGAIGKSMVLWEANSNRGIPYYLTTGTGTTGYSTTPSVTSASIDVDNVIVGGVGYHTGQSATGDTDTTNGYWSSSLTTYNANGVISQFKIQSSAASTQTYNPTFGTGTFWAAGWISLLSGAYQKYAQAQARIKQTDNKYAQSQAELIQGTRYNVHAQALGSVIPRFNQYAQARASIARTYTVYAQAAAKLAIYQQFAQAQANIRTPYTKYAQGTALIDSSIKVQSANAQAVLDYTAVTALSLRVLTEVGSAEVRTTALSLRVLFNRAIHKQAQAAALIDSPIKTPLAQAQAFILAVTVTPVFAQAEAKINAFDVVRTANALALIRNTYTKFAQATVYMRFYALRAQAQAYIITNYISRHAQANALISNYIKVKSGNAQAVLDYTSVQAFNIRVLTGIEVDEVKITSQILRVLVNRPNIKTAQSAALISSSRKIAVAQANAQIIETTHFSSGQAQARLLGFAIKFYANAQADILTNYQRVAQARAYMRFYGGYAQSMAWVQRTFVGVGQTNALIDNYIKVKLATAQAVITYTAVESIIIRALFDTQSPVVKTESQILRVLVNRPTLQWGQANALIDSPHIQKYAQARARVHPVGKMSANAEAYLIAYDYPQWGQAQADILKLAGYGNSIATIKAYDVNQSAQALAYSLGMTFKSGQAQTFIKPLVGHANALAQIVKTYTYSAQARARIQLGKIRGYAQAHAAIEQTYLSPALAEAYIIYKGSSVAQAQTDITRYKFGWGQALARISGHQFANAQASIKGPNNAYGNGIAFIQNTVYPIIYNNYVLPGYAQYESINDSNRIAMYKSPYFDGEPAQYLGSENKQISIRMAVLGKTLSEMKAQVFQAATMIFSPKAYTKLYLQRPDQYYLVRPKGFKVENRADTRVLEYSVDLEAKPWVYSERVESISGASGTLETVGRTFIDGTWTPATIVATGTDITVSGYTPSNEFTGYFSVSGYVSNLIIDSDAYTATIGGENANNLMNNLDYKVFIGPEVTYFTVSGATAIEISWRNRW